MRSFPSTLNESQNMYGSTKSQSYVAKFDIERLTGMNLNKSVMVVKEMLKENNINISNYQAFPTLSELENPSHNINREVGKQSDEEKEYRARAINYENPLQLPADIIALAKDYDWVYKTQVKSVVAVNKSGNSMESLVANTAIVPSMFNQLYGISLVGITRNTPLLNDTKDVKLDPNIGDCSIRTLCALSKDANSPLGQARYKYADFMYCKDLGKVPNNHLITLRKFAHPVSDHITTFTTPQFVQAGGDFSFKTEADIGRLITWFGTDENKLEDICKYSYHATWKDLTSQIQELESKADDPSSGILGMISNSFNPAYNKSVAAGQAGQHSIWGWLGSKLTNKWDQGIGKNNDLLRNYDANKVYTPPNTIQATHVYEGKLEFSQEFTLNFSYQLRAYDNINPRSALLDLLGNILEVTYRRGVFWGGRRKLIGPAQDMSTFDMANKFIDNAFDKLGGVISSLANGSLKLGDVLGSIGKAIVEGAQKIGNEIVNAGKQIANDPKGAVNEGVQKTAAVLTNSGAIEAAKGYIKNALGRPTMYAWNSILTGDPVGLWHVTVGNPRNPILSIGNLIITNAAVTHSGPLGIDDFPSELKVAITLKHARPRDITEISRMYTNGLGTIYNTLAHHNINEFYGGPGVDEEKIKSIKDPNKQAEYREALAKKELEAYGTIEPKNVCDDAGNSNPFLETASQVRIARTNNWSDQMLHVEITEAA